PHPALRRAGRGRTDRRAHRPRDARAHRRERSLSERRHDLGAQRRRRLRRGRAPAGMTLAVVLALGAGCYGYAWARIRRLHRPFPRYAPLAYGAGLAAIAAVLYGPLDALADASLSWHM